jgi:hypothetical protein
VSGQLASDPSVDEIGSSTCSERTRDDGERQGRRTPLRPDAGEDGGLRRRCDLGLSTTQWVRGVRIYAGALNATQVITLYGLPQ